MAASHYCVVFGITIDVFSQSNHSGIVWIINSKSPLELVVETVAPYHTIISCRLTYSLFCRHEEEISMSSMLQEVHV